MKPTTFHQPTRSGPFRRSLLAVVTVLAVLWPYMFSFASSGTTFTLANRTHYYMHARINNESFVYLAPGGTVSVEVIAPTSVDVRLRYSPGQSVRGTAERTFEIAETVNTSQAQKDASTCSSNNQGGNTCESTSEPSSSTTVTVTPGRWDVVPSDFTAE